ncbi:MAG: winged helix-turn-helix transcriptional regulator [Acidimicrobiia bacterium]|nr:winged helix-turn-helix transcriptional regulator [Acidimicrobiia bacterium]
MSASSTSAASRPGDPSDVGHTAGRAAARLARAIENALGEVELSLPQYRMLIFLSEVGSSAATSMAGKLGVSRPSVTALVDGLVARDLAHRTADPVDRRRVAHTITAKGESALVDADAAVARRLEELATKILEPHGADAAYAGLLHWVSALNDEREAKLADQ